MMVYIYSFVFLFLYAIFFVLIFLFWGILFFYFRKLVTYIVVFPEAGKEKSAYDQSVCKKSGPMATPSQGAHLMNTLRK
uniref:Uncharacterized protein n=1 Tax=Anguilla anguilla TaxID=7936 RepID=A0A0E9X460_ANGAN